MKKWFAYLAIFLLSYLIFLISIMPASFALSKASLPKELTIDGVSGSVWQMKAKQVSYQQTVLQNVDVNLSALSLLTFNPSVDIRFGDAMLPGPEGQLTLSNVFGDVRATNVDINIAANTIAKQLPSMFPMTAHDYISITLDEYMLGKPVCSAAKGRVQWKKASVTAFEETVKLGKLAATLSCDKGVLVADIDPKNNLGLTFSAYVRSMNKISGSGYLTPGSQFPEQVKPLLTFIGKADNQGRYRLSF